MDLKLKKGVKSFGHAYNGIIYGFQGRNFKIHLVAAVVVLVVSIWLQISTREWIIVLFLIGAVLTAELFNTAIETICNLLNEKLHLEFSETTNSRDLAAGAVLVMALAAALVGSIIFVPKIVTLIK